MEHWKLKFVIIYTIGKEIIKMGDIEVEKKNLQTQSPFGIKGLKGLIGQEKDYEKVMCLFIMIPKMSAYRKDFDEIEYVSFLTKK